MKIQKHINFLLIKVIKASLIILGMSFFLNLLLKNILRKISLVTFMPNLPKNIFD